MTDDAKAILRVLALVVGAIALAYIVYTLAKKQCGKCSKGKPQRPPQPMPDPRRAALREDAIRAEDARIARMANLPPPVDTNVQNIIGLNPRQFEPGSFALPAAGGMAMSSGGQALFTE